MRHLCSPTQAAVAVNNQHPFNQSDQTFLFRQIEIERKEKFPRSLTYVLARCLRRQKNHSKILGRASRNRYFRKKTSRITFRDGSERRILPSELSSPKFSDSHHLGEDGCSGHLKAFLLFGSFYRSLSSHLEGYFGARSFPYVSPLIFATKS